MTPGAGGCGIGVDLGTSGCRALALSPAGEVLAQARVDLDPPRRDGLGGSTQDPGLWWCAVIEALGAIAPAVRGSVPPRVCVDATSATLLVAGPDGSPLGPALMYDDTCASAEASEIAALAPADSPARGAGSSLAKLLHLGRICPGTGPRLALHQADWVLGRLTGHWGISDWNNALKLGYDPATQTWPGWMAGLDLMGIALPEVLAPGAPVGPVAADVLVQTGLPPGTLAVAGTTDSTAAVIAAGPLAPGDGVTCLGSTMVLKLVGERPVRAARFGVYSHRLGDLWLIGGASNSGGALLRRHFDDGQLRDLSDGIDPDRPSGLDYYPLPGPGERFPISDPGLQPRLGPRPADDRAFLHGMLEGMARIEASGYALLAELGAPPVRRVLTSGGGAANPVWGRIRERLLGVPVSVAPQPEAAYGAARLALSQVGSGPQGPDPQGD